MQITTEIKQKIDAWFDEGRISALLADLADLIAIRSVNDAPLVGAPYGANSRAALDLSRETLRKLGVETTVFEDMIAVGVTPSVDGGEELAILVHVDVVDANPTEWQSDPFTMDIRDGIVYGRGATDNKGPAIASFYAIAAAIEIAQTLQKGVKIIVGSAEEIGCVDVKHWLKTNTPTRYSFAPDACYPLGNVEKGRYVQHFSQMWKPTDATPRVTSIRGGSTTNIVPGDAVARLVGISSAELTPFTTRLKNRTGVVFTATETPDGVELLATGVAAHASTPEDGNNAQTALLALLPMLPLADCDSTRAVRRLAATFPHGGYNGSTLGVAMRDETSGKLTLSFNVLDLNETGFTASFDSRTPIVADNFPLVDTVSRVLTDVGFTLGAHVLTPSHFVSTDSEFVQTLLGIYRDFTGDTVSEPLVMAGMTYVHGIPGGVSFGTHMPNENCRIHGRDEFITLDSLISSAKMFTAAILRVCG